VAEEAGGEWQRRIAARPARCRAAVAALHRRAPMCRREGLLVGCPRAALVEKRSCVSGVRSQGRRCAGSPWQTAARGARRPAAASRTADQEAHRHGGQELHAVDCHDTLLARKVVHGPVAQGRARRAMTRAIRRFTRSRRPARRRSCAPHATSSVEELRPHAGT